MNLQKSEFDQAQRIAKALSESDLVPTVYKKNIPNCLIAIEIAVRTGSSPMMVMQNLHVIHGKPSWSSTFIIAAINQSKQFTGLRYRKTADSCTAYSYDAKTNELVEGPTVTMAIAKAEGWLDKNGSKWKTMPELMLMYRSATLFGRLYCPEILVGLHTQEEVLDIKHEVVDPLKEQIEKVTTVQELEQLRESAELNQDLTPEQLDLFTKKLESL